MGLGIKDDDGVLLGEDDFVGLFVTFGVLEVELHGDLVQLRDLSHIDFMYLFEQVHLGRINVLGPLKNEQLIGSLLVHDQILSTDDSEHLLAG